MSLEKEAVVSLPQLGARYMLAATAGIWMERRTS